MKQLLVAVDQSKSSVVAVKYCIDLARRFEFQIGLVEVTNFSTGNIDAGVLPEDAEKAGQIAAKTHIETVKANFPGVVFKEFEPIGNPRKEIDEVIESWGADLLIIGHHTHSTWHKIFYQSTELSLVNHLLIPLLIVPENFTI